MPSSPASVARDKWSQLTEHANWQLWRWQLGVTLGYFLLGQLAFAISVSHQNVTSVFFAPEGLALAGCIRFGFRIAPAIFVGQLWLALDVGVEPISAMLIALINATGNALGGELARRAGIHHQFSSPRQLFLLLLLIFLLLQPLSAGLGTLTLWSRGAIPTADWPQAMLSWWFGNAMGQLLVTPLLLSWAGFTWRLRFNYAASELLLLSACCLLYVAVATGHLMFPGMSHPLVIFASAYPLLSGLSLYFGMRGATVGNIVVVAIAVWSTHGGIGPFASATLQEGLLYLNTFSLSSCITALVLASVVEQRKVLTEKLRHQANHDPLTGVASRRQFLALSEHELARTHRSGQRLSLLMLDVDHFKQLNDKHGHATGDDALRIVASIIVGVVRQVDVVGRLGGEEFAVLLPDANAIQATHIAERIRAEIAQLTPSTARGEPYRLTVSIGLTQADSRDLQVDALLQRADQAMYHAKHDGRDCVRQQLVS